MKFSPSFQRGRLPDGGAGVDAATAAAIGLVALTASSTVSPSLLPAAGFAGAAGRRRRLDRRRLGRWRGGCSLVLGGRRFLAAGGTQEEGREQKGGEFIHRRPCT
jgi:hypothetical protein